MVTALGAVRATVSFWTLSSRVMKSIFEAAKAAIHLVSAWANSNRRVLGQGQVDDKAKESTTLPQLLKLWALPGATVTIDAMGCQKEIAQGSPEQGADYVFALKKKHSPLYDDVTLFLDAARANAFAETAHAYRETVDGDHGRIEIRQYWLTSALDW